MIRRTMENNSVSVIIPVYNSEKYIAETIESICKQTYDDFEVILVDDESSDGSIDTAKELLQRNEIKHTIIRQENKGLPGARNTGLKHAKGEFVCFIDSDDIISVSHIAELVSKKNDIWYFLRACKNLRGYMRYGRRFRFINRMLGFSGSQLALRYVLDNPRISSVVFGSVNGSHLLENTGVADIEMPEAVRRRIQAVGKGHVKRLDRR